MKNKPENPFVFALSSLDQSAHHQNPLEQQSGITLRDHYAGLAMQGLLSKYTLNDPKGQKVVSKLSFQIADEMLKARNQETE